MLAWAPARRRLGSVHPVLADPELDRVRADPDETRPLSSPALWRLGLAHGRGLERAGAARREAVRGRTHPRGRRRHGRRVDPARGAHDHSARRGGRFRGAGNRQRRWCALPTARSAGHGVRRGGRGRLDRPYRDGRVDRAQSQRLLVVEPDGVGSVVGRRQSAQRRDAGPRGRRGLLPSRASSSCSAGTRSSAAGPRRRRRSSRADPPSSRRGRNRPFGRPLGVRAGEATSAAAIAGLDYSNARAETLRLYKPLSREIDRR